MKAMILAAGLGERMRPLTNTLPKPLLKVGSSTLIELHLQKLKAAGIHEVVINISWLAEKIEQYLGDGSQYGLRILYSREETPLETAGGIKQALPLLGEEPFLVLNADVWSDYDLKRLLNGMTFKTRVLAHLVLVANPEHNPEGDFVLTGDNYLAEKQKDVDVPTYTFSGISVLHPQLFEGDLSSNKLVDVIKSAARKRAVSAEYYQGQWMDIGTPERLAALNALLTQTPDN
jgi:N-acetyl-alpha-D-muramate 1-phosphate uridylyltransferase